MTNNIKAIKTRLKGVISTKKITSAMKLVASIKFKKAENVANGIKLGVAKMDEQLQELILNVDQSIALPSILVADKSKKVKKLLLIVFSSNRGMCGGFNVNLVREIRERLSGWYAAGIEVDCFCLGSKAKFALQQLIKGQLKCIDNISESNMHDVMGKLAESLFVSFSNDEYQKICLIYNKFESMTRIEVGLKTVVPLLSDGDIEVTTKKITDFLDGIDSNLMNLVRYNLKMRLVNAFCESLASEYSMRMLAMDAANKNADDMIRVLSLKYNQTRQAVITNQLVEIISGAEAI